MTYLYICIDKKLKKINKRQREVLEKALKTSLKDEKILTGGNKYLNPKKKLPKKN